MLTIRKVIFGLFLLLCLFGFALHLFFLRMLTPPLLYFPDDVVVTCESYQEDLCDVLFERLGFDATSMVASESTRVDIDFSILVQSFQGFKGESESVVLRTELPEGSRYRLKEYVRRNKGTSGSGRIVNSPTSPRLVLDLEISARSLFDDMVYTGSH